MSNTVVKFFYFMSRGWSFWLPVLSQGEGFVYSDCPGRGFLPSWSRVPGASCPGGMIEDKIESRITELKS